MIKSFLLLLLLFNAFFAIAQKSTAWYNHTLLDVKNLENSVDFYTKVFQADTIPYPFPPSPERPSQPPSLPYPPSPPMAASPPPKPQPPQQSTYLYASLCYGPNFALNKTGKRYQAFGRGGSLASTNQVRRQ